jgi:hypothetical protein
VLAHFRPIKKNAEKNKLNTRMEKLHFAFRMYDLDGDDKISKVILYTANEGPVRIQYKCLVPIYVFPEIKLCRLVISKTEVQSIVLSPNSYTHISVRDLYISRIGLSILLQPHSGPIRGIYKSLTDT